METLAYPYLWPTGANLARTHRFGWFWRAGFSLRVWHGISAGRVSTQCGGRGCARNDLGLNRSAHHLVQRLSLAGKCLPIAGEICCQVEMLIGHDGSMLKQALGFALLGARGASACCRTRRRKTPSQPSDLPADGSGPRCTVKDRRPPTSPTGREGVGLAGIEAGGEVGAHGVATLVEFGGVARFREFNYATVCRRANQQSTSKPCKWPTRMRAGGRRTSFTR